MTKAKSPSNTSATVESLEPRRLEQEQRISSLRAKHTKSVIDGVDFDAAPIREAEDELAAILAAQEALYEQQLEHERREAEAEAQMTEQERRARIAEGLLQLEAEWLGDVEAIETAIRSAAAAYGRAHEKAHLLGVAIRNQGGSAFGLTGRSFESRVGEGISAILQKQTTGGNSSIGELKLRPSMRDVNLPWVEVEARQSADVAATAELVLSGGVEGASQNVR